MSEAKGTEYVNISTHADVLANGRNIGPSDRVLEAELTEEDLYLVEDGRLVAVDSFDSSTDEAPQLSGDALVERARELEIEGRSSMSADELRAAIADAEQGAE